MSDTACKYLASIVIRAYNEGRHIGKLPQKLKEQSEQDFEVILVDSGSTDDTVKIAEQFGAKIVHISKSDFSFGRALNIGCAAAQGKYLVFVSAHVYPMHEDWLKNLLAPFEDEQIAVSYGMQRGGDTNKFSELQIFHTWFPEQSEIPQKGYFCNNANCAIRRKDWLKRRYDEHLTGLEDLHWAKQAVREGGKVAYVAEAGIIHIHEESWYQVRNRYMREALALRTIENGHVRFTAWDALKLFVQNAYADMKAARAQGVFTKELSSIILFRFNQFLGTYLGYKWVQDDTVRDLRKRFYYPKQTASSAPAGRQADNDDGKREKNMLLRNVRANARK